MTTIEYAMNEAVIDYDQPMGDDRLRGYVEVNVVDSDDHAEIHIEDADGVADLRLNREELENLIYALQRAQFLLND